MARKSLFRRNQVHDLALILAIIGAWHANPASLIAGGAIFALGLFVTVWSKLVLQRNYELTMNGPYAICRHPFYLGNAIMDIGLCVMSGYVWLVLLFPLIFHVCYRRTFAYEEANLKELHPERHTRFSETTPLILPLGKRIFRDWRATIDWGNFFKEHIVSRSLRHIAYPLLIVLAARIWTAPSELLSSFNLTLIAIVFSARVASGATFSAFEEGDRNKIASYIARLLSAHPMVAWALIIIAAALFWEGNVYGIVEEVIPWGLAMLSVEVGIRALYGRSYKNANRIVAPLSSGLIGITLAIFLQAFYLAPLAFALIASRMLLPQAKSGRFDFSRRFVPTIAAAGFVLSISGIAAEICFDRHLINRVVEHVEIISQQDDLVVMVKNNNLNPLKNRMNIHAEVSADELGRMVSQRADNRGRLIVIVNEYCLGRIGLDVSLASVNDTIIGAGMDKFRVLVI